MFCQPDHPLAVGPGVQPTRSRWCRCPRPPGSGWPGRTRRAGPPLRVPPMFFQPDHPAGPGSSSPRTRSRWSGLVDLQGAGRAGRTLRTGSPSMTDPPRLFQPDQPRAGYPGVLFDVARCCPWRRPPGCRCPGCTVARRPGCRRRRSGSPSPTMSPRESGSFWNAVPLGSGPYTSPGCRWPGRRRRDRRAGWRRARWGRGRRRRRGCPGRWGRRSRCRRCSSRRGCRCRWTRW